MLKKYKHWIEYQSNQTTGKDNFNYPFGLMMLDLKF
jgi:hypothetical protein